MQQIEVTPRLITFSLSMETTEAPCPLCGQPSHRLHSRYQRTLQELSWCGKVLRLLVQVRRFFCDNAACTRKIFAERFPELTSV
ncbi:MAG TPA: transposase family protein, partial [Ktedonobacteraceae bacterium]